MRNTSSGTFPFVNIPRKSKKNPMQIYTVKRKNFFQITKWYIGGISFLKQTKMN